MPRYLTHITTDIGRDQVLSDLSHFDRAAEWDPGVAERAMHTPEPVGRGSRFAPCAGFLGRTLPLEYEIIDFWGFYLAYCEAGFDERYIDATQLLYAAPAVPDRHHDTANARTKLESIAV